MFYDKVRYQDEPVPSLCSFDNGIDAPPWKSRRDCLPTEPSPPFIDEQNDDELLVLHVMKITQQALRHALDHLLPRKPEVAGLLLGPADDDVLVTHYVPDRTGRGSAASFELDAPELNKVLKRGKAAGLNCKGIIHSHPNGVPCPSSGDLQYLRQVFGLARNADASQFYMPIVCGGRLYPYVYAQGRVQHAEIVLV